MSMVLALVLSAVAIIASTVAVILGVGMLVVRLLEQWESELN